MKTILTLLYGTTKFSYKDVHRIYNSTDGQYNYICLTDRQNAKFLREEIKVVLLDESLEGCWHKMGLFNIDIPGKVLYLDLDVAIQGDLSPVFEHSVTPTICKTYWKDFGSEFNSSVMVWEDNQTRYIYDNFKKHDQYYMTKYIGDDRFLYHENQFKSVFPRGLIYSFLCGVDKDTDVSPRAYQIKPEYPIVLLNGQNEVDINLRKHYDALFMHEMG